VGANGQVGQVLLQVLGPNALPAGRTAREAGWLQCDLAQFASDPASADKALNGLDLAAVYCVGGATDVERCETDVTWAMQVNCDGPAALARASRGVPFVFFSTDYVFDGGLHGPPGPYDEHSPTNPLSVYGRSKLLGEQAVLAARPDALIVRTTVVYGYDAQRKNWLYTLTRLLSAGTPMRIADDQLSSPTYNEDLARATVALVEGGHTGLFNIVGPEVLSRFDFSVLAAGILGLDGSLLSPVKTSELNQRAPRPLASGLKIDKLRAAVPQAIMRPNADAIRAWQAIEHPSYP
jgi:dTDP-4-dehydrorhamnose reductase